MAKTDVFYMVYDGIEDPTINDDPGAFAAIEEFKDDVFASYDKSYSSGYASKNAGLFLVKLTDVTDEQAEVLEEDPDTVVTEGFKGFNVEVVKSYHTSAEDWSEESRSDIEETGTPDADGVYRPEGYNDPEDDDES